MFILAAENPTLLSSDVSRSTLTCLSKQIQSKDCASSLTVKPCVGTIYRIAVKLEAVLNELDNSIDWPISSSSSSSKKKSNGRPRPCVVWDVKDEGADVLAITTFNGRMLTQSENRSSDGISNERLLQYVLAVEETPVILNKRQIIFEKLTNDREPLRGYLFMIPIYVSFEEIQSLPIPFLVSQSDLLYINEQLRLVQAQKKANEITNIDYSAIRLIITSNNDDAASQSTYENIPTKRSCFGTEHFDKSFFIEDWLLSNILFDVQLTYFCL